MRRRKRTENQGALHFPNFCEKYQLPFLISDLEIVKLLEILQQVHNRFMNFVILNILSLQFSNLKNHCVGYGIVTPVSYGEDKGVAHIGGDL
jgi:hypothetical protein